MVQYVEKILGNFCQFTLEYRNLEENLAQARIENNGLYKTQQKLKNYIQERKVYSEKLKVKIREYKDELTQVLEKYQASENISSILKEQIKTYEKYIHAMRIQLQEIRDQNANFQQIFVELAAIEENVDLKFRNRNQLILMIRSLSVKVIKHKRQCHQGQDKILNEGIDKFLDNVTSKKKIMQLESN